MRNFWIILISGYILHVIGATVIRAEPSDKYSLVYSTRVAAAATNVSIATRTVRTGDMLKRIICASDGTTFSVTVRDGINNDTAGEIVAEAACDGIDAQGNYDFEVQLSSGATITTGGTPGVGYVIFYLTHPK
jgi:hypothetical protein